MIPLEGSSDLLRSCGDSTAVSQVTSLRGMAAIHRQAQMITTKANMTNTKIREAQLGIAGLETWANEAKAMIEDLETIGSVLRSSDGDYVDQIQKRVNDCREVVESIRQRIATAQGLIDHCIKSDLVQRSTNIINTMRRFEPTDV